mgnify:CR=1 FL=1
MEKKHILVVSHTLELGGAERALLGLLENINTANYEVDLFLMRHTGELMGQVPSYINVLPEIKAYASLAVPMATVLKRGQIPVLLGRLYAKLKAKQRVRQLGITGDHAVELEYSHKYTVWAMPYISKKHYDLVISFLTPHYFAAQKTIGDKKIAWIHTDYSTVNVDVDSELNMWGQFDWIASISDDVTNSFVQTFPALKDKLVLIENIMPVRHIKSMIHAFSAEKELPTTKGVNLLSIGRFCTAKNFDNVPFICKLIRQQGLDVNWYLIGYGGDEALIRKNIREQGMEEHVIILGKKENPYPYIKACDVYVQPSRYEGKCVAVREAQMLGKPVIITNYATSASQLEDGVDGVIVPMDNEGCAAGIAALLRNPEKIAQLVLNCKNSDYSNHSEIQKLYQIME